GPADRTGKSLVTYCPGGTRPSGASWRLRWKPREIGLTQSSVRRPERLRSSEQVDVQRDDHDRDQARCQHGRAAVHQRAHEIAVAGEEKQRDQRERDAEGEEDLAEDQRPGGVEADADHDQGRDLVMARRAKKARGQRQPIDGPSPRDCGVLESGDGWCRPSSREPYSVISAALPPHGVCSSATSVLVVSSRPATEAPFCSAERTTRSGSMMPISIMLPCSPARASKPSSGPSSLVLATTSAAW